MNTNKNHFSPLRAGVQAKCLSLLILATITLAPGAAEVAPRLGSGGDYLPPPPGRYSYRITRAGTNLVKTILVGSAQVQRQFTKDACWEGLGRWTAPGALNFGSDSNTRPASGVARFLRRG